MSCASPSQLSFDAVPAQEGGAPVQHHELAVVALVLQADLAPVTLVVQAQMAAGGAQLALRRLAHLVAAGSVHQHAHLHPGAGTLGQHLGHASTELAFLPQVGLEMQRALRSAHVLEQHIEERAVLEYLHGVALHRPSRA